MESEVHVRFCVGGLSVDRDLQAAVTPLWRCLSRNGSVLSSLASMVNLMEGRTPLR